MNEIAIRVENLSKLYRIGQLESYKTLRETLTNAAKWPVQLIKSAVSDNHRQQTTQNTIWALKDVSFEIKSGEVVGFIGRNGAGKSTLLKVLSRITEPTKGRVEGYGRVGSLLEVGTGFHAELTGRENIYLNGAILGMSKAEVKRKFDEIVAFSEVEKFLDTPVKRYSSGMYVRLAFAVAAHLMTEILIVDEVLAVGDVAFRKKCLGKMEDAASEEGRTVIFVSHDMTAIQSLCQRAFLLDVGKIVCQGNTNDVVNQYLQSVEPLMLSQSTQLDDRQDRSGDGSAKITSLKIEDADGHGIICSTSRLKLTIGYCSERPIRNPQFSATIYDYKSNIGLISLHSERMDSLPEILPAEGQVTCLTEPLYLTSGRCYVNLTLLKGGVTADYIQFAVYFDIKAHDIYGSGKMPERDWVMCLRDYRWSTNGI